MTYRVLVASDHAILREGLVQLLATRKAVRASGTPLSAPVAGRPVDAVLCVVAPGEDILAVLQRMRSNGAPAPVLCLLLASDDEAVLSALKSGVRGIIDDSFTADQLVESIEKCIAGQFVMAPELATRLAREYALSHGDHEDDPPQDDLTPRENEVLALLAEGQTNRDIAAKLCVSEHTVRAHLRAIMQKLQVTNRVQAATIAWRDGLAQKEPAARNGRRVSAGRS